MHRAPCGSWRIRRFRAPPARRWSTATRCSCCATPKQNYPAWLDAINGAERWIHFESYIIHDDECRTRVCRGVDGAAARARRARARGLRLAGRTQRHDVDVLGAAATRRRRGARVQSTAARLRRSAGCRAITARCSASTARSASSPGCASATCGRRRPLHAAPIHGATPALAVWGPAVADIERAFADAWAATGAPLAGRRSPRSGAIAPAGDVSLRVIATQAGDGRACSGSISSSRRSRANGCGSPTPTSSARRRTCRRSWPPPTTASTCGCSCRAAAPICRWCRSMTRAGYRPLLEAGVRIFEWNGTMVHAKTAVADGKWARVGSSNLNIQSWLGNWELDVAIEDERFRARRWRTMFLARPRELDRDRAARTRDFTRGPRRAASRQRAPRRRGAASGHRADAPRRRRRRHSHGPHVRRRADRAPRARGRRSLDAASGASSARRARASSALKWPKGLAYPFGVFLLWVAVSWTDSGRQDCWRRREGRCLATKPAARQDTAA